MIWTHFPLYGHNFYGNCFNAKKKNGSILNLIKLICEITTNTKVILHHLHHLLYCSTKLTIILCANMHSKTKGNWLIVPLSILHSRCISYRYNNDVINIHVLWQWPSQPIKSDWIITISINVIIWFMKLSTTTVDDDKKKTCVHFTI